MKFPLIRLKKMTLAQLNQQLDKLIKSSLSQTTEVTEAIVRVAEEIAFRNS